MKSMKLLQCCVFLAVCSFLFLASAARLSAQGYTDITEDETDIFVDSYDDAPAPEGTCSTYTDIILAFNGSTVSAIAHYPDTAHASRSAPLIETGEYPGSREVIHVGEQRGGNCGVFLDTTVNISLRLGVSVNTYEFSYVTTSLAYYQPIPNCVTKCQHTGVTGPLTPFYEYVIENYHWFQYLTGPTGYSCVYSYAVPSNNVPTTGLKCYDLGLP
jgi:hypothetical protein